MQHLQYVFNLVKFALKKNKSLYICILLSVFSAGLELLALSALLPLLAILSGAPIKSGFIDDALRLAGIQSNETSMTWAFIFLLMTRIVTLILEQTLSIYFSKKIIAQLTSEAFDNIIKNLSLKEIQKKSMGYFIGIAGDESFRAGILIISLCRLVSTGFLSILYFYVIARYSIEVAYSIICFAILFAFVLYHMARISSRLGVKQMDESRRQSAVFLDGLNNIKMVRALAVENYVSLLHKQLIFRYSKTLFWIDEIGLLTKLLPVLLIVISFSGWFLIADGSGNNASLMFVVTIMIYLMRFLPTIGQMVGVSMKIASDSKSGRDVTELINSNSNSMQSSERQITRPIDLIEFRKVSYVLPLEKSKRKIIEDLSIKFQGGKSYALIGRSGIGKSTLIDLLIKLIEPSSGDIYVNNQTLNELSTSDLRKKILVVSQEPAIFEDSIISNLCLGDVYEESIIEAAAKVACIHEVIIATENGYQTRLQYQGKNLSGGERQRIGIARALIRNPEVMVFDESTSALDKITQEKIINKIISLGREKITIFITHDQSIMNMVDEIINLETLKGNGSA